MRTRYAVLVVLLALLAVPIARAAFPQDPPNDPDYLGGERSSACINDEQWMLFDFIPGCTPLAHDPEGASGMSISRAWRDYGTGDPHTVIAYVEAGINWRDAHARDLVNKIYLNAGELPAPTTPVDDGVLNVKDYSDTQDYNHNGYIDPEDLIVRFSDGKDGDHDGYVDDISGWDFYDNQNDPATTDSAYSHSDIQMSRAAAEANNGLLGAGACPRCMILPIKAGAEALDRGPDMAQAWLFAVDAGAQVVISETAELGYTTFAKRAAEYAYRHGTVIVESSNDFNSTDHQGGMYHPHVLPGNGLVPDSSGTQQGVRATTTYRERSSVSSWGDHGVFSVPAEGGTTSASDPEVAAPVALLVSYGRSLSPALSAPEAVQVLRATASDIGDPALAWPGKPGWDLQYGYGRPNVAKAMAAVKAGAIPPVAAIERPDWFQLYDPTNSRRKIPVSGWIKAPRTGSFKWKLELGLGPEPTDRQFTTIGRGSGRHAFSGKLGTIDLRRIPRSFWQRAFALSQTKELETTERYTVTLRLQVFDAAGRMGEDRRAITVQHDPTAYSGFPKRIGSGAGGESQAALADLNGHGRLEIVFGTSDGVVHAIDPKTRSDIRGWPVRTDAIRPLVRHKGVPSGHEPVLGDVAVGDLDGDGRPEVVATSIYGRLYVWSSSGKRRFARRLATGDVLPPIPRPDLPYTRLPHQGALAAPVLGDLNGDGRLEIIQAAWDGHIHAFEPDGSELPGWPVSTALPGDYKPGSGYTLVRDEKDDVTPALADLDGDGKLEVVERTQETEITGAPLGVPARGHVAAFRGDGKPQPGWPVTVQGVAEDYGSAQEFVTEGSDSPVTADVDGDGRDEVAVNTVLSPGWLYGGDGSARLVFGPLPAATTDAVKGLLAGDGLADGNPPQDAPIDFTTTGAFGRFDGGLTFAQAGSGAYSIAATEEVQGKGFAIENFERAWDAATGAPRSGFPAKMQGLDFIGAPVFADVTGDGRAELLDGADSNALHGFAPGGGQATGFPKFTSGWSVFSPSIGDLDGDGKVEVVLLTREGELFVWRTPGRASANDEWWRWHHDEWNSGRYGIDTRPPGAPQGVKLVDHGRRVSFKAPGDDWYDGRAARYIVRSDRAMRAPTPAPAGTIQTVEVPKGARTITIQALDDAGNKGRPVRLRVSWRHPASLF